MNGREFAPLGASQRSAVSDSSSTRLTIGTLPALNPAIRIIPLNPNHRAYYIKLGDNTVVAAADDSIRTKVGSLLDPIIIPVANGETHVAILAEGPSRDINFTPGGTVDGRFSPLDDGDEIAITVSDQRITLPTLGARAPAIRIVPKSGNMTALWVKLGDNTVTGSTTTSMRLSPGSKEDPAIIGVSSGETHLSIFCEGEPGNILLMPGDMIRTQVTNSDLIVSSAPRIIGLSTGAPGPAEELTLTQVLDFIGSAAQGDILYRGASAWARLAAGSTNRQRLLTGGASANPSWGGGIVTLASGSLPAAANFDITDIPSIYTSLILHVVNISHNSGSNQRPIIQLSTNNGSSFSTTEYRNSGVNASGAGAITAPATDNMISEPSSGTGNSSAQWIATVHLFNYAGGVFPFYMSGLDRVGTNHYLLNGRFTSTSAVNAIRVAFSGGSIDAGTYALYGAL